MPTTTHRYAANVVWTGSGGPGTSEYLEYDRSYSVNVEGKPELLGSADAAFRGDPARHNPEDLFVAAVAGCHMLTYLALCARRGVQVLAYEDEASGVLAEDSGGGGRFTGVELRPTVTVAVTADTNLAEALHQTAHELCFIANSCSVPIRCHARVRTGSPSKAPNAGAAG